ncbi:MAG: hypothetical protein Q4D81_00035 [Eubacteriales bacterium]|nr:hypothetical protein [Eubacteriales bacterium]
MKIKETPWEYRNLGVISSIEYYVSAADRLEDLDVVWNSEYVYQVLHIASANASALIKAQENGFRLIEMNIQLKRSLDTIALPAVFKRYEKVLGHRYADKQEIQTIIDIVRQGDMFVTDKVALDPYFGKKQSGARYAHWSGDILNNGGITVLSTYKNKPIGFEIFTEEKGVCTNFIGGVFPDYMNKGLGFAPLYVELLEQKNRGNKSVVTGVSSNNIPVLKLHELLGFKVEAMSYSLVKHM